MSLGGVGRPPSSEDVIAAVRDVRVRRDGHATMSLARAAYTVLVWIAVPFAALYLLWRSRRQAAYRAHWGERDAAFRESSAAQIVK